MSTNSNGQSVRDIYRRSADHIAATNRSYGDDFGAPVNSQPKFADMSSAQRSASMDNIAAHLNYVTAQVNALTQGQNTEVAAFINARGVFLERIEALERQIRAFASASFLARLRWLLTGK